MGEAVSGSSTINTFRYTYFVTWLVKVASPGELELAIEVGFPPERYVCEFMNQKELSVSTQHTDKGSGSVFSQCSAWHIAHDVQYRAFLFIYLCLSWSIAILA